MGCGALLAFLVRTRSGAFFLDQAFTLEDMLAGKASLVGCLAPFAEWPEVEVEQLVDQPVALVGGVRLVAPDGRQALARVENGRARVLWA